MLGLPLNMDGSEGPRSQSTRAFARNLSRLTPLPIGFWDERLSTAAVTRTLIDADASRKRRGEVVDKMAAAYILQGALDRMGRRGAHHRPPPSSPDLIGGSLSASSAFRRNAVRRKTNLQSRLGRAEG